MSRNLNSGKTKNGEVQIVNTLAGKLNQTLSKNSSLPDITGGYKKGAK